MEMELMLGALGTIFLVAAAGLVIRRFIGIPCIGCGKGLTPFKQLPNSLQSPFLAYFHQHEGRRPDTDSILICHPCRVIYDDFSGVKRSVGDHAGEGVALISFCKVCNTPLRLGAEPGHPDIRCEDCQAQFEWTVISDTEYQVLVPPKGTKVLSRCRALGR